MPLVLVKESLVSCTGLPARDLNHTALSFRCNKDLIFYLCKSCAKSDYQEPFRHKLASERALTVCGVVDKVKASIELYICLLRPPMQTQLKIFLLLDIRVEDLIK
jgi:hypothetical protein